MHLGLTGFAGEILYAGTIVAILLSLFGRPHFGIFFLVPILPLQTVRYRLHAYPLGANIIDLLILAVAFGVWRQEQPFFGRTIFKRVFLIYGIYTYLSLWRGAFFLGTEVPLWFDDRRLQDWKNYMVLPFVMFAVYAAIRTRKHMKILIVCMCLSVLALNRAYFSTIRDRDFSHFSYELRDAGAMGYAGVNGFAAFEAQIIIFLLGLYCFEENKWLKLIYAGVAATSVYCLMLSFSRGAYAALLLGWLFVGVMKHKGALAVLLLVLVCWPALVPGAVVERILMTESADGEIESSAGARLTLWEDALQVFKADPLFGTGFNTYQYMDRVGEYRDTHNIYVKVLVETGGIGLAIFLWMFWTMYRTGYRLFRVADDPFLASIGFGFAGLMICVVAANMFGDRWIFLQLSGYTFALLGLTLRGLQMTEEDDGSEETEDSEDAVTSAA